MAVVPRESFAWHRLERREAPWVRWAEWPPHAALQHHHLHREPPVSAVPQLDDEVEVVQVSPLRLLDTERCELLPPRHTCALLELELPLQCLDEL